jgi:molybdate transport system substrate-binding protein
VAAASLTDVIGEAARVYSDSTGVDVVTRFGASGVMARAIEKGTSADIFISADAEWVEELGKRGLIESATARILAWNRLVFIVPAGDSAEGIVTPQAIVNLKTIAIGDPETVPAGHYAKQALTTLVDQAPAPYPFRGSFWPYLEPKIVKAADVRAVLNLVETEQVEGGVVYATDAQTTTKVRVAFTFPEGSPELEYMRSHRQALGGAHPPIPLPVLAVRRALLRGGHRRNGLAPVRVDRDARPPAEGRAPRAGSGAGMGSPARRLALRVRPRGGSPW